MLRYLFIGLNAFLYLLSAIIIFYAIAENIDQYRSSPGSRGAKKWLGYIAYPVLVPFRLLLPARLTRGWDLAPMLALLVIYFLRGFFNEMH